MGILLKKMRNIKYMVQNEDYFLNGMLAMFIVIPSMYALYITLLATIHNVSIQIVLQHNVMEAINMITNILHVYAAYVIFQIKKNKDTTSSILAIILLFLSQILLLNMITSAICFYYICHFTNVNTLFPLRKAYKQIHKNKATIMAILVLFVSIIILVIKINYMY